MLEYIREGISFMKRYHFTSEQILFALIQLTKQANVESELFCWTNVTGN